MKVLKYKTTEEKIKYIKAVRHRYNANSLLMPLLKDNDINVLIELTKVRKLWDFLIYCPYEEVLISLAQNIQFSEEKHLRFLLLMNNKKVVKEVLKQMSNKEYYQYIIDDNILNNIINLKLINTFVENMSYDTIKRYINYFLETIKQNNSNINIINNLIKKNFYDEIFNIFIENHNNNYNNKYYWVNIMKKLIENTEDINKLEILYNIYNNEYKNFNKIGISFVKKNYHINEIFDEYYMNNDYNNEEFFINFVKYFPNSRKELEKYMEIITRMSNNNIKEIIWKYFITKI